MNSLNNGNEIGSNIIQAKLWNEKCALRDDEPGSKRLPLILYFDDYETNNPLGSHKGISKCGAVYAKLPSLPPEYQAKIENLFLFILFNTLYRTVF